MEVTWAVIIRCSHHTGIQLKKMPFKRGLAPIRRSLDYLKKGPIVFKERVKVMTVNYNEEHKNSPKNAKLDQHKGARDFVFWNLQQVRYSYVCIYMNNPYE